MMNKEKIEFLKSFEGKDSIVIDSDNTIVVCQIYDELLVTISDSKKILTGMLRGYGFSNFKVEAEENEDGRIMASATFKKENL